MADLNNTANIITRYAGSNVSGALILAATLAGLPPEKSQAVMNSLHTIYADVHDIIGAFANIWYIVFPVVSIWLARLGINSSKIGPVMDRFLKTALSGNTAEAREAKVAIVNAAATPALGTAAIVNPTLAADPATPSNVVRTALDITPTMKVAVS